MPRLKEVDSLPELANRALLSSVVQCCRKFSEMNASTLIELQEAVASMKERILKRFPPSLIANFSSSFINECASFVRDELHGRVILEMIMDIEIVGLQLTGQSLRFLKPEDAPRLRKLKELDLSDANKVSPLDLTKFHLHDLTFFKYPKHCTDSDLEIIGRNCPNLEVLDVKASESVTDEGLHFLSSCPNLRVVSVDLCPKVTHVSLSFLLSGNQKLEDFSYETEGHECGITAPVFDGYRVRKPQPVVDMLSGLDLTVQCPSLTRFTYENYLRDGPTTELRAIVKKFPNLKCFRIKCARVEDLSVVKQLKKLTELSVDFDGGILMGIREKTWSSFQEALTVIGANLTSLTLRDPRSTSWLQDDVNFIFDSCPNLEYLHIDQIEIPGDSLVIPPFPKLKELIFRRSIFYTLWTSDDRTCNQTLKFGNMLSLEILSGKDMRMDFEFLESMMLDNVKFPKLRVVKTNSVEPEERAKIEQTARDYNLDFSISNEGWNDYYLEDDYYYEDDCSCIGFHCSDDDNNLNYEDIWDVL